MNEHTDHDSLGQRTAELAALARAHGKPSERATIEAFVTAYYGSADPEDLVDRPAADLYAAAMSHYAFAQRRAPATASVRVFNPAPEEGGWRCAHTAVQIVNDDMPFLVDSVTMELHRHGLALHLVVHPLLDVARGTDGALTRIGAGSAPANQRESFIYLEVDRLPGDAARATLAADIERVLRDVRAAVRDWAAMREQVTAAIAVIDAAPPPLAAPEIDEGKAFLRWLADDHFTFLGYRRHDLVVEHGVDVLKVVAGTGLGILRETPERARAGDAAASFAALPPAIRALARRPELLVIAKSTSRSTVHKPGYLDYVAIKRFDAGGNVVGEDRFLGIFTSAAYSASPADVPLLRRKVANVVARSGFAAGSHAGKALANVLATYPRDELFQTGEDDLLGTATDIVHLYDRQRFRLFVRHDAFERFATCLVFVPREQYSTELRQSWQAILVDAFAGSSSQFNASLSDAPLARIEIVVRTTPGAIPPYDVKALEARLAAAARRWTDDLGAALVATLGEAVGSERHRVFEHAFPAGYREMFPVTEAVVTIGMVSRLTAQAPLAVRLYRPASAAPGTLRFLLVYRGAPVVLSDSLPMLEHMGLRVLDEFPHRITPEASPPIALHDFGLQVTSAVDLDVAALHEVFEEAFGAIFRGEVESDDFNRLVVAARLTARDIVILRAYAKYLRQIGFALSQAFIETTLAANADIARNLVELFHARFDPAGDAGADRRAEACERAIETALDAVADLSADRVLRQYLALIRATTRTNFWRRDATGAVRSFLSFKFDPAKVPGLPEPKPLAEIFVYALRFEGVHLRGGRVARGGLRWSDRREDFRTETLGLMKAQMVKNTVIVPVGSKGGFVLKRAPSPADRAAYLAEGVACYQDYLRGLLDLTDNLVDGQVVPPPSVRRHDADDPYLVVAADKGTARFSNYANAVSAEYGYWLGDAFASGGSAGYDHKAMGITARGAWESAKRHFRELGIDTQATDFTAAGIGDMSGDVFGNGMLRSPHIRLLAAFDHRHVFLDPGADAAVGFRERQRLFALPSSSWADYDATLISAGGGVHARSQKSIAITSEVKAALEIDADALTPAELVSAILKAPVDLIYNGGIGTYVKATSETHAAVGDRANDAVRVNGSELRCKVFVEGGNLGCTQLGRIEFAQAGGRINTDAIDNSGGVDTSDHEVNIKILFSLPIAEGKLTVEERNAELAAMTDDVAAHVLRDNYFQTQVLSVTHRIAPELLEAQARFIRHLEREGRLNRALEFLPGDDEIAARRHAGRGLTRPEAAVLLAYCKMWLADALVDSDLPDDPWVATAFERYFPAALSARYAAYLPRHPLRREIIAMHVLNSTVNRVGSTFVHRLIESTGARAHEVVRAYLLAREVFAVVPLWAAIEALDNRVDDAVQAAMLIDLSVQLEHATVWFLRSRRSTADLAATIAHYRDDVTRLATALPGLLDAATQAQVAQKAADLTGKGVPAPLATRVAGFGVLQTALDVADVAAQAGESVEAVAAVHFEIAHRLDLTWLAARVAALPDEGYWHRLARAALQDDVARLVRDITASVVGVRAGDPAAAGSAKVAPATDARASASERVAHWCTAHRRGVDRAAQVIGELRPVGAPDLAMLAVAVRELRVLA